MAMFRHGFDELARDIAGLIVATDDDPSSPLCSFVVIYPLPRRLLNYKLELAQPGAVGSDGLAVFIASCKTPALPGAFEAP
jgi:hypothetical protein